MINKIYKSLGIVSLVTFCLSIVTGCSDDIDIQGQNYSDGLNIELTIDANDVDTRALTGQQSPFTEAEKKFKTVDIFFYKSGVSTPVKVATYTDKKHEDKIILNLTEDDVKNIFGISSIEEEGNCRVFAVTNVSDEDYASSNVTKATATIDELRSIKAHTPEFGQAPDKFRGFSMITKNIDGDNVSFSNKKAVGTIKLKNFAAKIDVFIKFSPELSPNVALSDGTPTAEVHILNGVTSVNFEGFNKNLINDDDYYSIRVDANEEDRRGFEALGEKDELYKEENGAWRWVTSDPYYTYPNSWEDTPLETHATSLILKVDWKKNGENNTFPTYYSVPLDLQNRLIESNHYYRLKLNINSMGSENIGDPLEIEGELEVLEWGHADLEAEIKDLRYLEVSQEQIDRDGNYYTAVVNGKEALVTIPFVSSHKVELREVKIKWLDFQKPVTSGSGRSAYYKTPYTADSIYCNITKFVKSLDELNKNDWHCAYIDDINKTITIKHNLGRSVEGSNAYTPNTGEKYLLFSYHIDIILKHENYEPRFAKDEIHIIHHPSIYVDGEVNSGINDTSTSLSREENRDRYYKSSGAAYYHYGWARVNGENIAKSLGVPRIEAPFGNLNGITKSGWGSFWDTGSDNPIMYIINATQLEQGSPYHIRDPRVTEENHNLGATWASAPHFEDGKFTVTSKTYQLSYYYPTNESMVEEAMNAISPQYRVSSSFGACESTVSKDDARRRCASYQEAGYPAGRWRLPTYGEMGFLTYLASQGIIPPVFGGDFFGISVDVAYWTAHGAYKVNKSGGLDAQDNSKKYYVRCVYDDWYWTKKDSKNNWVPDKINSPYNGNGILPDGTVFVWGDRRKNNPQDENDKN